MRWPSLLAVFMVTCSAARAEDIHFLAEHLPEAAQDARYIALPWTAGPLEAGRWDFTVQLGWTATSAGFLDLDGPMLGLGLRRAWSDRTGLLALGFADPMTVSGARGTEVLDLPFAPAELGLPQEAEFTQARGTYRHWGVGAAWLRALGEERRSTLGLGLLYDHLSIDGFTMDYRLLAGPAAGTTGVLDHSSTAGYLTPFAQLVRTWNLGDRFVLAPRLAAAVPLPAGDFGARLMGPGFDLTGEPGMIGDPVLGAGAGLLHTRSGLELDLGVTLAYPLVERVSHPGVDRAWTLQVAWHSSRQHDRK
ncbi:MAG TPA: hypothetical protein VFV75_05385 [Candidatus Polarisedimenticolaceae bacterium]|nr:hypothetical protein [Candidatus Polarisedimenticolaceae bacterium]